jgi:periplasmic mercuric ion binding protein
MKKFPLFLSFILGLTASTTFAQTPARMTAVIKTPTVQCEECKDRIEKYLSHEDGILKVNEDYKRKTCTVTWLTDRTNIENIKTDIANVGYDADDITAEPDAYKRLPLCCKKPEDGGGHPAKQ